MITVLRYRRFESILNHVHAKCYSISINIYLKLKKKKVHLFREYANFNLKTSSKLHQTSLIHTIILSSLLKVKSINNLTILNFSLSIKQHSKGGMYVFQLFDYYGASGICLLWMCFFEAVVVAWCYGWKRFDNNLTEMLGFKVCRGLVYCWRFTTPLVTTSIFAFSVYKYEPVKYNGIYEYPNWAIVCGWCLAFCSILQIPIYIIYRLFIEKKPEEKNFTLKQRLHASLIPLEPQHSK